MAFRRLVRELEIALGGIEAFGFLVLDLLGKLQQRVALGDLPQFGFQLQLRQLQQADRLLQLRRQGQLLVEAKL